MPGLVSHVLNAAVPVAGGRLGAAAGGLVGGPPGAIAGAALGGAGARGWQKVGEYASGAKNPLDDTAGKNAWDIGSAGLAQAAGEGLAQGALKLAPAAQKLGAQLLKAGPAIPEKYGAAALRNPKAVFGAVSPDEAGVAYDAFEAKTGLKGLRQQEWEAGGSNGAKDLEGLVLKAGRKVELGETVSPQELYTASQAANRLRQMAKFGEPAAKDLAGSANVLKGKQLVEDALQDVHPEYQALRQANFNAQAKQAFSSVLPLNKNQSPNALRTVLAGREAMMAAAGALAGQKEGGHPVIGAMLGPALISPLAAGLAIRGASALAPVAVPAVSAATRLGVQGVADQIPMPQAPTPYQPPKDLLTYIKAQGGINPKKSNGALSNAGLPPTIASMSGKKSLADIARGAYERGLIAEEDPALVLKLLQGGPQ